MLERLEELTQKYLFFLETPCINYAVQTKNITYQICNIQVQTKNITYQICNIQVQTINITYQKCNIQVQTRERVHFIDNKSKDSNFILYFNMQVENFHRDAHCVENEKILGAHLQVISLT